MKTRAVAAYVAALLATGVACGGDNVPTPGAFTLSDEPSPISTPRLMEAERWTRQFGPGSAESVAVDSTGNVYVAGYAVSSLGPGQQSRRDVVLRKYDQQGTLLWSRQFGSIGGSAKDGATSLTVDGDGRVYVAGRVTGTLTGQESAGQGDAFVRKYDASGAELWTKQFGSTEADSARGVGVDAKGNVYVAGHTFGVLPDQVGAGPDAFLRKYGPGGEEVWTRQFGSPENDNALGVAVDSGGNVYVAGWTGGALTDQVGASMGSAFLRKYDPAGAELWTREVGYAKPHDVAFGVAVDAKGNVYVSGSTDLNPEGQFLPQSTAFLHKYDSGGEEQWRQFLGETFNRALDVAADWAGNVYVAGSRERNLGGGRSISDASKI